MPEDPLVTEAYRVAMAILNPPLSIQRGAPLLYAVVVNNALQVTVDPRKPVRGRAAFETDLCVFESRPDGVELPRVVMEFKPRITTHDVLTYSTKARKHKAIYPYLRYGIIMAGEKTLPGRVFVHNEALDFALAYLGVGADRFPEALSKIIDREISTSRQLEQIAFSKPNAVAFYTELGLEQNSSSTPDRFQS